MTITIGTAFSFISASCGSVTGGRSPSEALAEAHAELERAGIEPEYLEARDAEHLGEVESFDGRAVLIAVAARVGRARLIDNVVIGD